MSFREKSPRQHMTTSVRVSVVILAHDIKGVSRDKWRWGGEEEEVKEEEKEEEKRPCRQHGTEKGQTKKRRSQRTD